MKQRAPTRTSQAVEMDRLGRAGRSARDLVLIMAVCATATTGALAQHPRKGNRKSQPVPITRTAPDVTGVIPSDSKLGIETDKAKTAIPSPTYTTTRFDEGLPKPFELPAAPRARMRACGLKWQAIRLSGEAHSDTWREFATKCLVDSSATKTSR